MHRPVVAIALSILALMTGCATSQNVSLAQMSGTKTLATVALVQADGNSADMDNAIKSAFSAQGVAPKQALPAGTRKSSEVDVIVDYTDQWRWDIVMYLRWVAINMYDADTGNLLANARWDNSAFHGFQDYKAVVKNLVDDMVAKVKARPK